ncbi:MAG: hypothetical protein M1838_001333 [Thelocarpon superellum]|nr:MAG: hypothetical protein M1838_001333 [Thelocarpon superellum]
MDMYPTHRSPLESTSPVVKTDARWSARDDDVYRRRSPEPSDRRPRQRNRSRSPPVIDRYQPAPYHDGPPRDRDRDRERDLDRDRDRDRNRDHRRRPPSPVAANIDRYVPGQEPRPLPANPIADPHKLDHQVGFSYFGEWWRYNEQIKEEKERQRNGGRRASDRIKGEREAREDRAKEKGQIQVAYDAYKEELQVKMAKSFVQAHKNDEWFKERYLPELRDDLRRRLNDFRRGPYSIWERDLEAGTFDEFTLEGIYKGDSNGVGGIVEKEEGEAVAHAEVLGVGDLLPSKGGDIRDETAFQPALLIKTMAPTVSRAKIEEFCKEHLGESEGGFRWLSLSDPNPSKRFHRIGWVMLHPGAAPEAGADRGDGRDEEREDADDATDRPDVAAEGPTTTTTAGKAQEAVNGKTIHDETRGDFTCHVGVHVPPTEPRKKALWDLFSAPERVEKDLELALRLVAKLDRDADAGWDGVRKMEERVDQLRLRGLLQPPAPVSSRPKKKGQAGAVLGLDIDGLDDGENEPQDDEDDEEDEGAYDEEVDDEELIVQKKKLDLLVEYLRRVHNFCFFCVFESDSVHELARKCPGGHLRRPRASLNSTAQAAARASALGQPFPSRRGSKDETDGVGSPEQKFARAGTRNEQQLQRAFNWVRTFEDKLRQILDPDTVDLRKLGGVHADEAVEEEMAKFVRQEDESKFRCKVPDCTKLFKGQDFWKKHVEKRHPEWLESLRHEADLVNQYVLDPAHIAPSRSDANSNGHFPNGYHYPSGTPRGFNLSHMPMGFNPVLGGNGMFPPSVGFPVTSFHQPIQRSDAAGFGAGDDRHQTGPVRRGGRYGGSNRPGPYDRRPRDGRDPRWAAGAGGGLSPPHGGMSRPSGAGKWGDGAGGMAVLPREAVQGRSLKSYEDLDAVGGGGGGELNY